jgi:dTDP-4-amino-4,6-dideoxygalactose transaminase
VLRLQRSFGHVGDNYFSTGINGKNSEFHAAMGICNLRYIPEIIAARKEVSSWYDELLITAEHSRPVVPENTAYNYAYYPIIVRSEDVLEKLVKELKEIEVSARRYFYPSLNTLPFLEGAEACPISEDIAVRVLCLPLYYDITRPEVEKICRVVNSVLSQKE